MEGAREQTPKKKKARRQVAEPGVDYQTLSEKEVAKEIKRLEHAMYEHAEKLEFEAAAEARDQLKKLKAAVLETA